MTAAAPAAGEATAGRSSPGSAVIETVELRKQFGATVALAGLTMTVRRGEVFGFLGPNGAGKTTAVKLLLGLSPRSGGSGHVLGAPLGDVGVRRRIGYLPELFRYQGWMTAREVLELHCDLAGLPRRRWAAETSDAVELVGLADRATDRVQTFSKGMQQRLGLAVALLGAPDLVLLDEPTSALDPVGRQDVRRLIAALRERGVTVFLNSHLLTEVERVCDRVAIVDHGRVVAQMTMAELLEERAIRIRLSGVDAGVAAAAAAGRGHPRQDGEWLVVEGIADEAVPALVRELVAAGASIHAVVPTRHSLEERFFELLGEPDDDRAPGEPADEPGRRVPGEPAGPVPGEAPPAPDARR